MRRFLSFTLGLIFGIVFLLGTFGLAMYTSVTAVHPNEIYSDLEKYLGDLGDVSLLQAYNNILKLYNDKTGGLTDGNLYSVGDFLADNHISTTDEETGDVTAFGIVMPKELLNAPLFEYFNTTPDAEGNTGVQRALKQIKLSAIPAVVNMFSSSNESGEKIVADGVVEKLDEHSVYELLYRKTDDEVNIISNLAYVTEDIKLVDLIPSLNSDTETDNLLKNLLYAVGEAYIGSVITDLTGDNNLFGMVGADGSLSEVGKLNFADILGEGDPLISSLLGAVCVADFVAEDGSFAIMQAMDKISIGGLFGVVKRTADVKIDDANITRYDQIKEDGSKGASIWVGTKDGDCYISVNAGNIGVDTTWYYGKLVCEDTSTDHEHGYSCYDYLWHKACDEGCEDTTHTHVTIGESGKQYVAVENTSLYRTIATLKMSCLFDAEGAFSFDNFVKQFDSHSLSTIINELLANNETLNKVSTLLKLDDITLSQLLADGGFDNLLSKVTDVSINEILKTFDITGIDFIPDVIGNKPLKELVDGGFNDISIGDLIGLVKREITDVDTTNVTEFTTTTDEGETIVELSVVTKVDGGQKIYYLSTNYNKDADTTAEDYVAPVWYEGKLACKLDEHSHNDTCDDDCDKEHTHGRDCYDYVWYQKCKEDCGHAEGEHTTIGDKNYTESTGMFSAFAGLTIGDLTGGGNFVNTILNKLTLGDVLQADLPSMLESLKDTPILQLKGAIETTSVGNLIGFTHYEVDINESGWTPIIESSVYQDTDGHFAKADGNKYYLAGLSCKDTTHDHIADCYSYIWYGKDGVTPLTGIQKVLADKTINDLSDFGAILKDVTLGDVLEDELPSMLESLKDVKIGELSAELEKMYVGNLLKYKRSENTGTLDESSEKEYRDVDDNVVGYIATIGGKIVISADGETWYDGKLICKEYEHTCDDSCEEDCTKEHTHGFDCYSYLWYKECTDSKCTHSDTTNHKEFDEIQFIEVTGAENIIAGKTINDLQNLDDVMNELTLADVFGGEDKVPSILRSIANTKVGNLDTAINTIYVGEFFGYEHGDKILVCNKEEHTHTDDCGTEGAYTCGKEQHTHNDDLGSADCCYEKKLVCEITSLGHIHDASCYIYGYEWWERTCNKDDVIGHTHCTATIDHVHDESADCCYKKATGITAKIANERLDTLSDIGETVKTFTLRDVLQDSVPDMLTSIADTPIGELDSALDELYVGEMLGYTKGDPDGTRTLDCHTEGHTTTTHTEEECYYANYKWFNGETQVDGMMAKIANKKVGNLGTIGDDIQSYTIVDILGKKNDDSALIKALYDTPVGEIGSTMNNIQLGTAMGYYRNPISCTDTSEGHVHSDDCSYEKVDGKFVWYQKCEGCTDATHTHVYIDGNTCVKVGAPQSAFVNSTLSGIGDDISGIKLGELVNIDDESSSMLRALKDTPIDGIGNAINTMALGTSMGFVRREIADTTSYTAVITDKIKANGTGTDALFVKELDGKWYEAVLSCKDSHTHGDDCYDFVWYEKCTLVDHTHSSSCPTDCTTKEHSHSTDVEIEGEKYLKVTGLNAKMANLTVQTMGGNAFVEIVDGLSMRDLIDSGVLTFDEEEKYKLAIMSGCCSSCNLSGYIMYKTTHTSSTTPAQDYFNSCHSTMSEEERITHRDQWQDCTLNDFITNLLNGI